MTKDERDVEAKLRRLSEALLRNQRMMRKAFVKYQELISEKMRVEASIGALRTFREARRRNALNSQSAHKTE